MESNTSLHFCANWWPDSLLLSVCNDVSGSMAWSSSSPSDAESVSPGSSFGMGIHFWGRPTLVFFMFLGEEAENLDKIPQFGLDAFFAVKGEKKILQQTLGWSPAKKVKPIISVHVELNVYYVYIVTNHTSGKLKINHH